MSTRLVPVSIHQGTRKYGTEVARDVFPLGSPERLRGMFRPYPWAEEADPLQVDAADDSGPVPRAIGTVEYLGREIAGLMLQDSQVDVEVLHSLGVQRVDELNCEDRLSRLAGGDFLVDCVWMASQRL